MVKHSLKNMINKYPYFMDSNPNSNFYKVTHVYNENFKELYNNLFHVYESFHLNKKLIMWKEQEKDYAYKIHFNCNFPNIKNIKIYKNDVLIRKEEFLESEEKTSYEWIYDCFYAKTNMLQLKVFKCLNEDFPHYDGTGTLINECEGIYFGDNLPLTCEDCNTHSGYRRVKIYRCNHCGEIYFDTEPPEACRTESCSNNTSTDYTELFAYKCTTCGEIYLNDTLPEQCDECKTPTILETKDLYYNDERVVAFDNSFDYDYDDILFTEEDINNLNPYVNTINNNDNVDDEFNLRLPVIPDDKFLFYVETWEEYYKVKGFPENDTYLNDEYDHDFTLDEIGALHNIPRKNYLVLSDTSLLPLTEPPYNNQATEDDYHYMKRILEYMTRLWLTLNKISPNITEEELYENYLSKNSNLDLDEIELYNNNPRLFTEKYNPTSLEFWKNYSVESRLINRERYLLKLFDITKHNSLENRYDTALSEDWTPELWEHKDKFCDDTLLYDKFFYVYADNLRPVKWEDVKFYFKLENSLTETINDYPYLVDIYRFVEGRQKQIMTNNMNTGTVWSECIMSYKEIVLGKPCTFRFIAHEWDTTVSSELANNKEKLSQQEEVIGVVDIILNAKWCENADWYVDGTYTKDDSDGSINRPFKTLTEAIDNVSKGYDVIALKSSINFKNPFLIDKDCKIIGCGNNNTIPVINNVDGGFQFFKLSGGKRVNLKLVDLKLKNDKLTTYIPSENWTNTNLNLNDFDYVIIRGGLVIVTIELDAINEFYPTDNVPLKITVTTKNNEPVRNQNIVLSFDNEELTTLKTDGDGVIYYNLAMNKTDTGVYSFSAKVDSDEFFSAEETIYINATKEPVKLQSDGSSMNICIDVTPCGTYTLYSDELFIRTLTDTDCDGEICFDYTPVKWGVNIITVTDEDGTIIYEAIVNSIISMSKLVGKTFIKNIDIDDTKNESTVSNINYTSVTVKTGDKLSVLNGVVIKLGMANDYTDIQTFQIPSNRLNSEHILSDEAVTLSNALTSITYNSNNSEISYTKLGNFWE